ncbi:MAG: hypothetical protein HY675_06895 [Chloroflexi bacterium]|nr:hypothetical protein [Chloroflexota bacterium]
MIRIQPRDHHEHAIWETVLSLSRIQPRGWALIGAQMVSLLGIECGKTHNRRSLDIDVLANVRILQNITEQMSDSLQSMGFKFSGASPDGVGHRFENGMSKIDLLAPDGVGPRANITTVYPAHTVQVPGGSQALSRTEAIEIILHESTGSILRPSLLGAIILKAHAVDIDDVPESQLEDLAFLLSLVENARSLAGQMGKRDRRQLRRRVALLDPGHDAWIGITDFSAGCRNLRVLLRQDQ